jgi:hypothetical protein
MNETKQPGEPAPIPRREWVKGLVFVAIVAVISVLVALTIGLVWWPKP